MKVSLTTKYQDMVTNPSQNLFRLPFLNLDEIYPENAHMATEFSHKPSSYMQLHMDFAILDCHFGGTTPISMAFLPALLPQKRREMRET